MIKFFVNDFSTTMQARMLIFGMHVDGDLLYRGIEDQSFPAYSSLYLSNFISFYSWNNEFFFIKDFSTIMQVRMLICGMQVDYDLLYRGIEDQYFPAYSSLYLSNFHLFHTVNNEIFHQRFLNNHANLNAHIYSH